MGLRVYKGNGMDLGHLGILYVSWDYLDMGLWTTQDLQYYGLATWDNKRMKKIPWQS